jgi:hypothetical protein
MPHPQNLYPRPKTVTGKRRKRYRDLASSLEGSGQLRALADLGAEEKDEVDESAEAKGDEADGRHGPRGAHVVERQDAEMCEGGGHDEGGDEEGGDCGGGYVGVGICFIIRISFRSV